MSLFAVFAILVFTTLSIEDRYNKGPPDQELECEVRLLAYQYALMIQEFRGVQPDTFNALQIDQNCDKDTYNKWKKKIESEEQQIKSENKYYHSNKPIIDDDTVFTVYVDPINGNDNNNNGSISSPYKTLSKALSITRSLKSNTLNKQIILREGISYIPETINLSPLTFDSNLLIRGYPNEHPWISGGILLNVKQLNWTRYNVANSSYNIWSTSMKPYVEKQMLFNSTILSLFTETPHQRLTRARYPNGKLSVFFNNGQWLNPNGVNEWWPAYGEKPKQIFKNLSNCATTKPCLNYSFQTEFNYYTAGYGGLCDLWDESYSYWCGLYAAGGWAFDDARIAQLGIRQIPVGMTYNTSLLSRINSWKSNFSEGVIHLRHQQKWNVYMYSIGEYNQSIGNISFASGGWQGGRTLDSAHPNATSNQPIEAGGFYFSGILDELDISSEWYYDISSETLYYWPVNTTAGQSPSDTNINLVIGNLATLFKLSSPNHQNALYNVTISDIGFRDTRYTYLDKWLVPSGGDWALYNGGAIYLENTTNCTIENSAFVRLDGNAIQLYGYNRNTTLYRNEFELIGDNVMGALGKTNDYDGTHGLQPRQTYIIENYVHDIGLYQEQSSLWFQAKSCQNHIIGNIGFNLPRAAILFNDAFGGGNECTQNLFFATCTETGDHGPINAWNRMPFMTNVAHGYPSYDSAYSDIYSNFIIADYHGSQAFDTDDGSAWFNIYNNFFYDAMGFKNDFGGYNIKYFNNINICWKGGNAACWNIGPTIYNGLSDTIYDNKCMVFNTAIISTIDWPSSDVGASFKSYNNSYYTSSGNVRFEMQNSSGSMPVYNISELQTIFNLELGSTANIMPSNDEVLMWARNVLNM